MIILQYMGRAIILALIAGLIIKLFLFDFMITSGHSMDPTVKDGSVLIINRIKYGLRFPWQKNFLVRWSVPKQGELIIFYTPSGDIAIKRCQQIHEGLLSVYGDNTLNSYDSRVYGQIPVENVIGKVLGYK